MTHTHNDSEQMTD